MRVAIMQPYFMPYIGYWQLIRAVDIFVILDDVNYIKRGWINRNYILCNGQRHLLSLPVKNVSQNRHIRQHEFSCQADSWQNALKTIKLFYHNAPYFSQVFPLLSQFLSVKSGGVTEILAAQFNIITSYLDIPARILISSEVADTSGYKNQAKILQICKYLGATEYVNLPGGKALYDSSHFAAENISLNFIEPGKVRYDQFGGPFVDSLSFIDILMFNDKETIGDFLLNYELSTPA